MVNRLFSCADGIGQPWSPLGQCFAEVSNPDHPETKRTPRRGSSLQGVSAAIKDADWEQAYKNERFPTKYHLCVSMLFHIIDEHMRLEFKGDHVAIVLDPDGNEDDAIPRSAMNGRKRLPPSRRSRSRGAVSTRP